jgi:hypothetical protein
MEICQLAQIATDGWVYKIWPRISQDNSWGICINKGLRSFPVFLPKSVLSNTPIVND